MENTKVIKLALCEATVVVLRPSTPYVFEAVPGCEKCRTLLSDANDSYEHMGLKFDYADPATADFPIYATTETFDVNIPKKKKKSK